MNRLREFLAARVEQGEPSTEGTWYTVPLDEIKAAGFDYIEVHFPDSEDDETGPNDVRLTREDGEFL